MSAVQSIPVNPLSAAAFSPFGQIIDIRGLTPQTINAGSAQRFDTSAQIQTIDGDPGISLFVAQPQAYPIRVCEMERHPLGSQTFMPLDQHPYLVVVADGGPDGTLLPPRAFLAAPGQGVSYPAGLWHHPLLALVGQSRFLVVDRRGPGGNLELARYPGEWQILAPPASS